MWWTNHELSSRRQDIANTHTHTNRGWQLTVSQRWAGKHHQHDKHQIYFKFHLIRGPLPSDHWESGPPRQLCSSALRLFPLRYLTGRIISSKNILRESGRNRSRGGAAAQGRRRGTRSCLMSPVYPHAPPSTCWLFRSRTLLSASSSLKRVRVRSLRCGSAAPISCQCVRDAVVCVRSACCGAL